MLKYQLKISCWNLGLISFHLLLVRERTNKASNHTPYCVPDHCVSFFPKAKQQPATTDPSLATNATLILITIPSVPHLHLFRGEVKDALMQYTSTVGVLTRATKHFHSLDWWFYLLFWEWLKKRCMNVHMHSWYWLSSVFCLVTGCDGYLA